MAIKAVFNKDRAELGFEKGELLRGVTRTVVPSENHKQEEIAETEAQGVHGAVWGRVGGVLAKRGFLSRRGRGHR